MLTQARLKELLTYDPESGVLHWRVFRNCNARAGQIAGYVNPDGYRRVNIDRHLYVAHRLAWLYVHGTFPPEDTDHVNRDRGDNRIVNLRLASRSQNLFNRTKQRDNTSGFKGVTWAADRGRWQAQCKRGGKNHFLGYFDDAAVAHAAYVAAAARLHGEFARAA